MGHPDTPTRRRRISSLIYKVQEEDLVPDLRFHPFNEDEDARIIWRINQSKRLTDVFATYFWYRNRISLSGCEN
jgi:hypothetical protein